MADSKDTVGLNFDSQFTREVERAAKAVNKLVTEVGKLDVDALRKMGTPMTGESLMQAKAVTKEFQNQLNAIRTASRYMSGKDAIGLKQVQQMVGIQSSLEGLRKPDRRAMIKEYASLSVAEQQVAKKAVEDQISKYVANGRSKDAREWQEYGRYLKESIQNVQRLRSETIATQRAIDKMDSRTLGNQATQYDNRRAAGTLGAYRTIARNENGLQALKERIALQKESLKIAKATAIAENTPTNERRVSQEKQRLKRLTQMERSLSRIVGLESSTKFNLNPVTMAMRSDASRRQTADRMWGDGGASLFRNQAGMMGNYALMGAGIGATTMGVQFVLDLDKAFRQLQAILALSNGELSTLSAHLVDVSEKTKFTALEVVDAATTMGQAGFSTEEIRASIESVTMLATAIGTDLKSAVDLQTSVMGIYNKNATQMMNVSDKIVTAINTSKLNLEKLTLGMQYSGNISSQLGVSFEENMAALAAMANSGIRSGSTLGTGMRQVYIAMQKPSTKFLDWLDEVGLSLNDIDVRSKGLYNVLKTLRDAGFDMTKASSMWETRAASAVGAIFNNMSKFKEMMADFDTSMGAASQANATQMEATRNQLDRLGSIMGTLVAEGAEPLRQAFTQIVKITADWLSVLRDAEWLVKSIVTLTAGWAVGKGLGGLFSLGKNILGVGGATGSGAAGAATGSLAKRIVSALIPMLTRAGPIGMAVAGTAAAGMSVYNAYHQDNDVLDKANTALSENVRLYNDQQKAISKVTSTIYEMDTKHNLLSEDQDALRRFTSNLSSEFGGLGLILDDVEGDFGKTRTALIEFRDGLIEANPSKFPGQSYKAVSQAQKNLRGSQQLSGDTGFSSAAAARYLLGDMSASVGDPVYTTWGSTNVQGYTDQPKLKAFLAEGNANALAYQKLVTLFTEDAKGSRPIDSIDTLDKAENAKLLKDLNNGLASIEKMAKDGYINSNTPYIKHLIKAAMAQGGLANKVLINLREQSDAKETERFDALSADIQKTYHESGITVNDRFEAVKANKTISAAKPKDSVAQARLGLELLTPILKDATANRDAIKADLASYDEDNGTSFEERVGDIAVWNTLNSNINEINAQLKGYQATLEKNDRYEAKQMEETIKVQKQEVGARVSHTNDLEALTKVQNEYHGLLDKQLTLEKKQLQDTEQGEFKAKELDKQYASERAKFDDQIAARQAYLQRKAITGENRRYAGLAQLGQSAYSEQLQTLNGRLSGATSTEEASKLGEEIKAVIKQKVSEQTEAFMKKLGVDPDSQAGKDIQATYEKVLKEQLTQTDLRVTTKNGQIERGIFRRQEREMLNALRFEQSFMNDYINGDTRLLGDQKKNTRDRMSNIYKTMRDPKTTSEQVETLKTELDSLVEAYFKAQTEVIKNQEKNPEIQAKRIKELVVARDNAMTENQLAIDAALRAQAASLASKNDTATRDYNQDLQHEYTLTSKGLDANRKQRTQSLTNAQTETTAMGSIIAEQEARLSAEGLSPEAYTIISGQLRGALQEQKTILVKSYEDANAKIQVDITRLQDLQSLYGGILNTEGLAESTREKTEQLMASAGTAIENLNSEVSANDQKIEELRVDTDARVTGVEKEVYAKTHRSRYQSTEYLNAKANIHGGEYTKPDGSTFDKPDPAENVEGLAGAWETATAAAEVYSNKISETYSGYDDALTSATLALADATDQAVNKAASLATEIALGAKDGKSAWEELGQFVLQMLTQIAMQIAITSAVSAATGGQTAASGGVIRRSTGGTVPTLKGSLRGQDSVNAVLMPEEYVIRASVARNWGTATLNAINNGDIAPEDLNATTAVTAPSTQQGGSTEVNVWVVADEKDAGNGGIGPNDVVAVVADNINRRGQLRTLIQSIKV